MTENSNGKGPLRYRLYFWLMDACLFFAAIGLIDWIIDPYDLRDGPGWYMALGAVTLVFNGLVPLFLMVARPMRDDYAEGLWKRSLVVMAYGSAIVPPMLIIGPWILYGIMSPLGYGPPAFYQAFMEILYEHEFATYVVVFRSWLTFMLLFVGVFQFLRWKDSR